MARMKKVVLMLPQLDSYHIQDDHSQEITPGLIKLENSFSKSDAVIGKGWISRPYVSPCSIDSSQECQVIQPKVLIPNVR